MGRYSFCLGAIVLLLTSCAQVPAKSPDVVSSQTEQEQRHKIIANFQAHSPPTHAGAQDITYNSHFPAHFPPEAIRARHYGTVSLKIYVDANGDIGEIQVERSSGYPELDASAIDAAKHWVFMPAAQDGVPQPGWVRIPVNFGHPIPPPPSTDGLQVGVSTEADARMLLGEPGGTMRYTSGITQMIWGDKSVGMAILTFDESGKLTKITRTAPATRS